MAGLPYILLKKFDPVCMEYPTWLNYFEYLIDFLQIPDDREAYILLNMLENNTLLLLKEKIAPEQIESLSYNKLIDILEEMYSSYPGKYAARLRFENRHQLSGESAKHYAETLTKLIRKCDFIYDEDSILLDRFVTGVRSERAVHTLLQIRNLTLDIAIKLTESIQFYENKYYRLNTSANMNSNNLNEFSKKAD